MANYPATSPPTISIGAALRKWLYSIGVIRVIATALFGHGIGAPAYKDACASDPMDDSDYDNRSLEDILSDRHVWSSDWHTSSDGTFRTKAAVYRYADAGYVGGAWVSSGDGEPFFDFESEDGPIFDLDAAMKAARDLETSHHCSIVSESARAA